MYITFALVFVGLLLQSEFANNDTPLYDGLYKVVTMNNDTLNLLSLGTKQLNIFVQRYGCHTCYIHIDNVLKRVNRKYGKKFTVNLIVRCENNIISRNYIKDYILDIISPDNIFFDIHKEHNIDYQQEVKEGLFGKYNVKYTPGLLLINGNSLKYHSYKDIFGKGYVDVEKIIEDVITKELLSN